MPLRGPEDSIRTSLAIFIRLTATVFKAPCASTIASCAASASNLFFSRYKRQPGKFGNLGGHIFIVSFRGVYAGANCGTTQCQFT